MERQIRTFKEVSEGILGASNQKRVPTDFELLTLFREAECIMNCRPLEKYKVDVDDLQPLRPLDLMTGYMEPQDDSLPMWDVEPNDKLRRGHKFTCQLAEEWWEKWQEKMGTQPKNGGLRRGHKFTCQLAEEWWEKWLRHYPERLQERQKWTSAERNIQKGDFVLLLDDTTPPVSRYPYATVVGTKMCKDGKVRSVTVRMGDGRVRERDIRKIVLLEAVMSDHSADCSATERNDCITNDDKPFVRACERTICAHSRTVLFAHTHGLFHALA